MIGIDLGGRLALVTGATGELGRVMVRTLAAAGADVAVHYHRAAEIARELAAEVRGLGRRSAVVQADVGDRGQMEAARSAIERELGSPDIVVTNAVVQFAWTGVLEQSAADYESQFRSSVLHNVHAAQLFVQAMVTRGWGRVIGINTECSMQYWKGQSAYISGKRGMDGVLRVLAREVGQSGVTVNQVAPGWTVSENRPESDGTRWYRDQVPLGRRGTDQEIANVVAFLASDLASFITGAWVPVCGGNVMPAI